MPTPVGPLGPDEIDPFDPDLWDWDAAPPEHARRRPTWITVTAAIVIVAFGLLAVASVLR